MLVGIENTQRRRELTGPTEVVRRYRTTGEAAIVGEQSACSSRKPLILESSALKGRCWNYLPLPEDTHDTIFHPAALRAFRVLFAPEQR